MQYVHLLVYVVRGVQIRVYLYSFFILGAKGVWVVNATPRPLYRRGREPVPLYRSLGEPQGRLRETSTPKGFDPRTVQLFFQLIVLYTYIHKDRFNVPPLFS
jgi:hypothetical protein